MTAVIGAFCKYFVSIVFYIIVAVLGMLCGKKIHDNKKAKKGDK